MRFVNIKVLFYLHLKHMPDFNSYTTIDKIIIQGHFELIYNSGIIKLFITGNYLLS